MAHNDGLIGYMDNNDYDSARHVRLSVFDQGIIKRGDRWGGGGGAPHLKDADNFTLKGHITQHSGYMGKTNRNELMVEIYSKSLVIVIGVFHMTFS